MGPEPILYDRYLVSVIIVEPIAVADASCEPAQNAKSHGASGTTYGSTSNGYHRHLSYNIGTGPIDCDCDLGSLDVAVPELRRALRCSYTELVHSGLSGTR